MLIHKMLIHEMVAVGLGVCLTISSSQVAQAQVQLDTICRRQNTLEQSDAIRRGQLTGNRYVVVVITVRPNTLDWVRQCVPDAFISQTRLGAYIHAGSFQRRSEATRLSRVLQALGLDARVEFFR